MPVLGQDGLGIGAQYLGETTERLREVEDASFGTLPSRLSLALAETTLPLDALRRAARIAARYLDISPAEAGFRPYGNTPPEGPLSLWTDPLTGSVVSLATARRILRPYERSVAQRILEQLASRPAREGVRGRVPVIVSTEDVDRLTEAIRALAPLRGEDLPFQDALAFAIAAAADRGLDLDLVRANLEYLASLPGLDPHPLLAAEIARRAAGSGRLLRSPAEVVAIVAPGYEEAVRLAETPAGQRPASAAFAASRAALGPAAEASLATSAALAGVRETSPGGTGVRAELAQVELGQRLVMGLELPGSFLESLRDAEQDYVRAGRRIAEQVKIPFTDTVAGRAVLKTLDVIVRPFDAVTRIVFDRYLYVAPFGQEEAGQGGRYNISEALHDAWDIMLGRTTAARELAQDTGMPEWLTFVGQLLVGSKLDPVAAALSKYGTLTRGRRFLVTLAEEGKAAEWPVRVEEWIRSPMARFGPLSKLTRSEYLVEAALRERDPAKYFARAVADFRAYHAGVGIDPLVAERIWRLARSGKKLGLSRAEIVEAVDDVLRAGFGIPPRGGSVAARVLEETEAYVARRAEQLPLFLADGSAYRPPPTRLRPEAARFVSALDDAMLDLEMRGPRMLELPHRADPVSRLEHRLRISPLAETTAGRTIRSLLAGPDTTPQHVGAYLEIPVENPARAVREFRGALIRSQVFSNEEIERAALAYAKAIRPSSPTRGVTAASVVSSYERTMLRRIWQRYGIDEDTARVVLDRLHRRFGGSPRSEVFAALAGEEGVTLVSRPILATQEVNALRMIDPALVRRAVSETIGTWRRWTQAITRGLGASRPVKVPIRRFIDDALDAVIQDAFLSWYRPLVVIRPAYVLRIVGIEETSRFLSTVGLSRWASSGRVLGGERIAQAAERLGFMGAAERIRARGEAIVEIPELAQLGYEPRIRVPNPSGLAEEPLVNAATSQFGRAIPGPLESRLREALSPTSWGAVERTREDFVEWWWHALVHQFGRDEIGSMYLRDIADGLDEETSVLRALEFLRSDEGRRVATRIMGPGYTDEALEVQVRTGVRYARQLTGSNPELARAAAEGTLTPEALRAVPQAARPEYVHGPLLSETVLARTGPLKRGVEAISRMIMQTPTNRLTRQKYFRTWYTRTLEAQLRVAQESGLFGMRELATELAALPLHSSDELARKLEQIGALSPEAAALVEGMQASARAFAIDQVRRIMFDFTRQGRLDEVTRHFLMFVQPYAEFWVSWGRIIRQNPSVLAVANRIGVLGSRSGIVREDPETGELIVPLSLWAGAAPLLAAVTGGRLGPRVGGGWQLSAPLASFNLFMQSAVPIPTGELAGEVPIPVPSLNPQAVALLQNMLERSDIRSDVRARLASWLFAYGPVDPSKPGTLLPAWLHHAIASVFPEWFEAEQRMQQTHFLQLQQAMGLDPDPDLAREQARRFAGLRALFALVFPAAPRIEFPTAEMEAEWRAIRDSSPDWTTARQRFLELHPDMDLITMARTMWEQDNGSPVQIPATLDVQQLLSTKGAREFAERHPRWVWAIIPRELREGELDIGAFFAQLASGDRQAFTPEEFIANAEVQRGWDAYAVARDAWVAWQEAHPDLGPGDPPYDEQYRDFQATIEHIAELNPAWRVAREKIELAGVDPAVLAEARQLAKDAVFARTEAGKWLRAYLELRDRTARELADAGVSSLETQTAQRLGITERYQAELERLNERYPDGATAYRIFFTGDLKRVPSAGDRALDRLPEGFVDQELTPWWERYEELRRAPEQATDESARTDAYNALRSYVDAAFERFPNPRNPLILRWKASDPTWREEVLAGILGRPYPYLDRFAKQVLGERTSGAAERIWTRYLQMRAEIARAEAIDPSFSSTRAYEALGRWVAAQASANAVFARQLEHANSWTWRVRRTLEQLLPDRDRSDPYWQALFETVDTIQSVVDRMRLGGSFDQRAKAAYNAMRQTLVEYIEQLRRSSLEFDRQWEYLEGLSGTDPLIGYLMPAWGDYYGPIQGYGEGG